MYFPLKKPNLPQDKVTVAAVSEKSSVELFNMLSLLGIQPIKTKTNSSVDLIGHHTDLNLLNLAQGVLLADESQRDNFVNFLTIGYMIKTIKPVRSPYPDDSRLNCIIMGDKLICNSKTVYPEILSAAVDLGYRLISVNQGYTKCSVCVLNDNALITDDESIYNICEQNQIDSIIISKGSIKLKGFDYGFIGGCTGLVDKNKLLFNGDINYHKDCNLILDFLNKHNIEPIILENEPLTDIGSIIPLCEKRP